MSAFGKVGSLWLPQPPAEQTQAPLQVEPETDTDVATTIKLFLDGLRARPIVQADLNWMRRIYEKRVIEDYAGRIAFALSNGHQLPKPKKPKKVKRRRMGNETDLPRYFDENGKPVDGAPKGAYLRVRTHDALVEVIEHRPAKNGDWSQSIRWYGPFKTADEQRAFVCRVWRAATAPGSQLDAIIKATMEWVRFDE